GYRVQARGVGSLHYIPALAAGAADLLPVGCKGIPRGEQQFLRRIDIEDQPLTPRLGVIPVSGQQIAARCIAIVAARGTGDVSSQTGQWHRAAATAAVSEVVVQCGAVAIAELQSRLTNNYAIHRGRRVEISAVTGRDSKVADAAGIADRALHRIPALPAGRSCIVSEPASEYDPPTDRRKVWIDFQFETLTSSRRVVPRAGETVLIHCARKAREIDAEFGQRRPRNGGGFEQARRRQWYFGCADGAADTDHIAGHIRIEVVPAHDVRLASRKAELLAHPRRLSVWREREAGHRRVDDACADRRRVVALDHHRGLARRRMDSIHGQCKPFEPASCRVAVELPRSRRIGM